jgi:two-component system response regulator QseB
MHVLIVEDDRLLVRGLRDALARWSHSCLCVGDAPGALAAARDGRYDAILLDLGLVNGDGLQVLVQLRREGNRTPVLVATARDGLHDRIAGLDAGAVDYLVKPFHLDELAARLRAVHRRAQGLSQPLVEVGSLSLDTLSGEARAGGVLLRLSRPEFALLCALAERAGRMVPRAALERALYGDDGVESNALEVHVHMLRRKLWAGAIRTIRGFGYMLVREEGC